MVYIYTPFFRFFSLINHYTVLTTVPYAILSLVTTAKSLQSCPTLCDPIDGGPPGSPVPGILQARDELEIYKLWLRGPRTRTMDLDSWFRNINPP